jgi:hypothetical protein
MRYLLALAALLLASNAFAQAPNSAVLTCTAPTKNTDGSSISGAITYKFYEGANVSSFVNSSPPQTSCAYTWANLAPGTHFFAVTASVGGVESAMSNMPSKVVPAPTPSPPTNLTVTNPTAYEMRTTNGKLVAYAVGTTSLGSLCGTEERVVAGVSYRRVEHADLVVWPQKLPLEAWARCG